MGTIRKLTDLQLASIGTTKVFSISSSETLFQISSGNRAFEAGNLGSFNVFYGQSNLLATSGLFIASNGGAKFWDTITDNFQMAFAIGSGGVTSQLIIQEYAGN
jgi:hypothetical protein